MPVLHPPRTPSSGEPGRNRRRAAAAVEFAVVSPLLFLLIFGIIEFGRLMMLGQLATNSARAAARVGSLSGSTTADISAMAGQALTPAGVKGASVKVYVNDVEKEIQTPPQATSWKCG